MTNRKQATTIVATIKQHKKRVGRKEYEEDERAGRRFITVGTTRLGGGGHDEGDMGDRELEDEEDAVGVVTEASVSLG